MPTSPEQDVLAEPMRSRWSPTVLDPHHVVDRAQVRLLLEAARWAPSCGNGQQARFVVAPRGSAHHAVVVEHLSRGNAGWVPRASLLLVSLAQRGPDESGEGGGKPAWADHDLGQAVAHLTLQAVAVGLVCHQFAGFDREGVGLALGVPDWLQVVGGIAVGVPGDPAGADPADVAREQRPRTRRPVDDLVWGGWDGLS